MSHENQQNKTPKNSFWEPGNYMSTTERITNGYRLASALQVLFQERAKIEESYSKNLQNWASFCSAAIDKGIEHGTVRSAMKGIPCEAECLSAIHARVKTRLNGNEFRHLKMWQNCTFHPVFTKIEEQKIMEESFKKVQKPYVKKLAKVNKARRKFHMRCEKQNVLLKRIRHAADEKKLTSNEKKAYDRYVRKLNTELAKSRREYEMALDHFNKYRPTYVQCMTAIFARCQYIEGARLSLSKNAMHCVHNALNIVQDESLSQVYEDIYRIIECADPVEDLEWWSKNYGADMPICMPTFEEYPGFDELSTAYGNVFKNLGLIYSPKLCRKSENRGESCSNDNRSAKLPLSQTNSTVEVNSSDSHRQEENMNTPHTARKTRSDLDKMLMLRT